MACPPSPVTVSKLVRMHMRVAHGEIVSGQPRCRADVVWPKKRSARVCACAAKTLLGAVGLDFVPRKIWWCEPYFYE